MEKSIKLSAIVITFNEERNIGRCLDSLKEVADEIIVVDSFSTDKTELICNQQPLVTFVKQSWLGYSAQKNFANALASHDYIFSIDADEALSPELVESIKKIKNNPVTDIYIVKRLTNYCGQWIKHCGWYPDKKIRIWKKKDAEWQGEIHETLRLKNNLSSSELQGDLLHYSYYTIKEHLNQVNNYTELLAIEALKKGKKSSVLQLFFSPLVKFIKSYFIQLGFLDGYYGFIVSTIAAQTTFYKYLKIHELLKKKSNN
ncbi:MAG TPA: glycosyltransferase family 2 protein [Cytophagaceae bacterium]|nr:glycosyltransferase family 2 protein [Cytophagaceae bacterium]